MKGIIESKNIEIKVMYLMIELMDRYFADCDSGMTVDDFYCAATAAFFIASKTLLVESFNLDEVREIICDNKFSSKLIVQKEAEVRKMNEYRTEICSYIDHCDLILRCIKLEFIKRSGDSRRVNGIISSTCHFFDRW